jgi:hypothetical protein
MLKLGIVFFSRKKGKDFCNIYIQWQLLEAFYRIPVQENIANTLGGWLVTHPENCPDRVPLLVGALRSTLSV